MPAQPSSRVVNIQDYKSVLYVELATARLTEARAIAEVGDVLAALVDRQAGRPSVVLDISRVQAMSSQMLGKLIAFHKGIASLKGRLAIAGASKGVKPLFKITKLDKLMNIQDDPQKVMLEYQRKPL